MEGLRMRGIELGRKGRSIKRETERD
jgi:hypothetical protein